MLKIVIQNSYIQSRKMFLLSKKAFLSQFTRLRILYTNEVYSPVDIYIDYFLLIKMIQKSQQQSVHSLVSDRQLIVSITNINQIMEKINLAVRKTQQDNIQARLQQLTFDTHENLMTEPDDSQLIHKIKSRVNGMKIPLHQLHKKNKLSTVIQQSHSQSGRTYQYLITPRQQQKKSAFQIHLVSNQNATKQIGQMQKELSHHRSEVIFELKGCEEPQIRSKKITGIRRTSNLSSSNNSNKKQGLKQCSKQKRETVNQFNNNKSAEIAKDDGKFQKTKSMTSFRCTFFQKQNKDYYIDKEQKNSNERTYRKDRKGLSLMCRNHLKQEASQIIQKSENVQKNKISSVNSSQAKKQGSQQITIKRKTIKPFLLEKNSKMAIKEKQKENVGCIKTKSTRINVRQFFFSKRINK